MLCLRPRLAAVGWTLAIAANRWALGAFAILAFAVLGPVASAQEIAQDTIPAGYQVYPLQFADPGLIGDELAAALTGPDGPPDVLIDRQLRRVLVKGDDATQNAAKELVQLLDRQPKRDAAGSVSAPALQNYRVPRDRLDALANDLRQTFPPARGVRVVADQEESRLVVRAPADVQKAIAARLATRGGTIESAAAGRENSAESEAGPGIAAPAKSEATQPNERRSHILRNITWRELEEQLGRVWEGSLQTQVQNNGELAIVQAPTTSGQGVSVEIDRRRDQVTLVGPSSGARAWERIVQALDRPYGPKDSRAHLVRYRSADPRAVQRGVMLLDQARRDVEATATIALQKTGRGRRINPVSFLFQPAVEAEAAAQVAPEQGPPVQGPPVQGPPAQDANFQFQPEDEQDGQFGPDDQPFDGQFEEPPAAQDPLGQLGAFVGAVRIEFVEELGIIIVQGNAADVARVMSLIEQIEGLVGTTTPVVEIYHLRHANSAAIAALVTSLYDQVLLARQGQVSITPLGKPNALLLIGRDDSVQAVIGLIAKLDQPTPATSTVKVFSLRSMSAVDAQARITAAFPPDTVTGLEPRIRVVGDYRSNALIVVASPSDMVEVEKVLAGIDVASSQAVDEFRIFRLRNAIAIDLAPVLQDAINGQLRGAGRGEGIQGGQQQQQLQLGGDAQQAQIRSHSLIFAEIDRLGGKLIRAGITYDVRITADEAGNALLVTAPPDCMELIAAVIEQLDQLPNAQASIKVFKIVDGDATALANMLQQLFGGGGGQDTTGLQALIGSSAGTGESALVPLNFGVDTRTNSIIVAGAPSDLLVVEAILLQLDETQIRERRVEVYRLRNSPAQEVANTVNDYLNQEAQFRTLIPDTFSGVEQLQREVIVVPESVSNSLIVAATPRYFDQVRNLVMDLDRRPPMIYIAAVIAEVNLNRFIEFGLEFGLQDSLLFDRSTTNAAGNLNPGFNFNNQPLGNSASGASQATRDFVAGQGLSHFGVGRTNPALGYGGLVLSAASDSVNILLRALQENGRAQVLSRPSIMTLDNQGAYVQVGARVPYITQTQVTTTGTVNSVELQDVGIILGVRPRVNPDGLIVMEVDVEKSELGPDATGVPISINANGDVIRAPQILISTTQTTVSARSGQTIILGGLITKSRSEISRRVPYLSDIPILGNLFRFDSDDGERTELLVILTPVVMYGDEEIDWVKVVESDRMSWVLGDLVEVHGEVGLSPGRAAWGRPRAAVIFPADDPTASTFFNTDRDGDGDYDRYDEPNYDPNYDPNDPGVGPAVGPNVGPDGAEEIPSGGVNPASMSRRRQPQQIPPPSGVPTPAAPLGQDAGGNDGPGADAQSNRRTPPNPYGASAANAAWNGPYVGPPEQGPVRQAPWYAESENYAQPAGYVPGQQ